MANVKITKTVDGDTVEIDGVDITNAVKAYSVYDSNGSVPEVMIDIDAGPEIVYDGAELKWKFELPDEKMIRKALYQKLKIEFEVSE